MDNCDYNHKSKGVSLAPKTFEEVINCINAKSVNTRQKGAMFEQIAKNYLLTNKLYDFIDTIWLWDSFPYRFAYDAKGQDIGIDLVALTKDEQYIAIQCKCYGENNTISLNDVTNFVSCLAISFEDSEQVTHRFTQAYWVQSAGHISSKVYDHFKRHNQQNEKTGATIIKVINSAELATAAVDWEQIWNNRYGELARLPAKELLPHQQEAITKAYDYFITNDNSRGKLIMACGTGKTFTSLKIVEKLFANKQQPVILFLVPSIALLGQSLQAWKADSTKDFNAICVCSDNKASSISKKSGNDDSTENHEDVYELALPACTNADTIKKQFNKYRLDDKMIVVFSTYQSIQAVSDAQQAIGADSIFDMIICDEAHRTTGAKLANTDDKDFMKVHNNEVVQAHKRLYMTATPKIYGAGAKSKADQDNITLCSMDDEETFGKEFYRVSFSYAVEHQLLTDYKVLVLTIKEGDLPESLQKQIEDPNVPEYNTDITTKLLGVCKCFSKIIHGDKGRTKAIDPSLMRRALIFCSKIGTEQLPGTSKNVAKIFPEIGAQFVESINEELRNCVIQPSAKHIDGSMNALTRSEILNWVRSDLTDSTECRVLTNVRCLSEGVDVPALDAIVFLAPKNSQVDIVQSVGRVP